MSRVSKKKAGPGAADSRLPEPASTPAGLHGRWMVPGVCLFLAAITFAVFGQTLHHGFVSYDDGVYVADNPAILSGLSLKGIAWAFTHYVNVNWTPLTVISHMLDCQFYGIQAGWHHLTSVLLHMTSAIVLFLVLKEMTGALWRSAFVAAVFAIHPLHVESVAWIAERRDVLSGFFFMLTLGAYAGYVRHPQSLGRYLTVVFMLGLALMSKPMVVTLPFVLLLLDYWPLKRFTQSGGRSAPWRLIAEKVPLLALSGAVCVVTFFAQQQAISSLPLSLRIGNALVSYVVYLGQMVYPAGLAPYYPYPQNGLPLWKIIMASVLLLVISNGAIAARRKQPWFLAGWLWYLGMLVPVIGLIQSGLRAHADRYTYLPQIGLYLGLTWAVADLCAGWRPGRRVLGGLAAVILVALILCAYTQTSYWRNSETLFRHALAVTENNALARNNLGVALGQQGQINEAIRQFQEAIRLDPDYIGAYNNLGNALIEQGSVDEAISQYQEAIRRKPDYADAYYNLGIALAASGRLDEAIRNFRQAIQINSNRPETFFHLGRALDQSGRTREAVAQYQQALRLDPNLLGALNNLAWIRAASPDDQLRNGTEAVHLAERACELTHYDKPLLIGTLAAAYAEAGRFPEAVTTAEKAEQLATSAGLTAVAAKNRQLLELYRAGKPYHESPPAASSSPQTPSTRTKP